MSQNDLLNDDVIEEIAFLEKYPPKFHPLDPEKNIQLKNSLLNTYDFLYKKSFFSGKIFQIFTPAILTLSLVIVIMISSQPFKTPPKSRPYTSSSSHTSSSSFGEFWWPWGMPSYGASIVMQGKSTETSDFSWDFILYLIYLFMIIWWWLFLYHKRKK